MEPAGEPGEGGCFCGAVRFTVAGPPTSPVTICDCTSCRRSVGAAGVAWATWPMRDVQWTGTPPAEFESSPGRRRRFCVRCGTSLSWSAAPDATDIDLAVAAFDDPDRLPPFRRIFCADAPAWQETEGELPRHAAWARSDGEPAA